MSTSKQESVLASVLLALIPYTRENMMLTFSPNRFFNELEKVSGHSEPALRVAFNRAQRNKVFSIDRKNRVMLSVKARQIVQPFVAEQLVGNAELMVIFDIPEEYAGKRRQFRTVLKLLEFDQIQQSVWCTTYDHRSVIFDTIVDLELGDYVQLYEAARIH